MMRQARLFWKGAAAIAISCASAGATALAQSETPPPETSARQGEGTSTQTPEGARRRAGRKLRPAPVLDGAAAVLFHPPTPESLLDRASDAQDAQKGAAGEAVAQTPGATQEPSATEQTPDGSAAQPAAEAQAPEAIEGDVASNAAASAEGAALEASPDDAASGEGSVSGGEDASSASVAPDEASPTSGSGAEAEGASDDGAADGGAGKVATPSFMIKDREEYPFLEHGLSELVDTTDTMLDNLPPLTVPTFDPDLLQFGMSYSVAAGTGTLPGARAEVARCGVRITDTHAAAPADSGLTEPGHVPPAPPANTQELFTEMYDEVCCSYDPQLATYRCGDPSAYPNREQTYRASNGDEMMMVCFDVPEEELGSIREDGVTYVDGSPIRAGSNCCAISLTYYDAYIFEEGAGGSFDVSQAVQGCAPARVGGSSGFGSQNGKFAATTEIYAEGSLHAFSERRRDAYRIEAEGRLSLLSSVVSGDDPDKYTLRGQFKHLAGAYRAYVTEGPLPAFGLVAVDFNDAVLDVTKETDVDVAKTYTVPARLSLGVGMGRIYDIEPRIRLRRLEAMLIENGVIEQPLPHEVARDIMLAWWTLRAELGYDQRLLYTFKVLKDAGLLTGALTPAIVYRFGQILEDPQLIGRRQGSDTHVLVRLSKRLRDDGDDTTDNDSGEALMVLELHDEHVYNISYDTELFWDLAVGFAPREKDWADNLLAGERLPFAGLLGGKVAANLPVGFRVFMYDSFLNKLGVWELQARLSAGHGERTATTPTAPDGLAFTVGAGAKLTLFQSTTRGLRFVVDADVGRLNDKTIYAVVGGISMTFGHRESFYVAPGDTGDALPFELPLPRIISGP